MPLTNAQKQSRQRERTKAKLERLAVLEAALREIVAKADENLMDAGFQFAAAIAEAALATTPVLSGSE